MNQETPAPLNNNVYHPTHYNKGNIECIDGITSSRGIFRTIAFCQCNILKYLWRQGYKDDEVQEIDKAIWYEGHEKTLLSLIKEKGGNEAEELYKRICAACDELDRIIGL